MLRPRRISLTLAFLAARLNSIIADMRICLVSVEDFIVGFVWTDDCVVGKLSDSIGSAQTPASHEMPRRNRDLTLFDWQSRGNLCLAWNRDFDESAD